MLCSSHRIPPVSRTYIVLVSIAWKAATAVATCSRGGGTGPNRYWTSADTSSGLGVTTFVGSGLVAWSIHKLFSESRTNTVVEKMDELPTVASAWKACTLVSIGSRVGGTWPNLPFTAC